METVYVKIPPKEFVAANQPDGGGDALDALDLPFAFCGTNGVVLREGTCLGKDLPTADEYVAIVASTDVTLLLATIPPLPKAKLLQALPNLIEDKIAQDIQNIHCVNMPGDKKSDDHTVAVIDKAWMHQIWRWLTPRAPTIRVIPAQTCVKPMGLQSHLLVDIWTGPRINMLQYTLSSETTQDLSWLHHGIPENISANIVQWPWLDAVQDPIPLALASGLRLNDAEPAINERFQITPYPNWKDIIPRAERTALNFAQGAFSPRSHDSTHNQSPWRLTIFWMCLTLLAFSIGQLSYFWRLWKQNQKLDQEINQIFSTALPNYPILGNPVQQLEQEIANRKKASGAQSDDFFILLDALAQVTQTWNGDQIERLSYDSQGLLVTLKPGSDSAGFQSQLSLQNFEVSEKNPQQWLIRRNQEVKP